MRKRALTIACVAVLTATIAAVVHWYSSGPERVGAAPAPCGYAIGVLGPLTGAGAFALPAKRAVQLAVDGYNKGKESSCLVVKAFDTATDAPSAAQAAVDDKTVVGIVGPMASGGADVVGALLDSAGLSMITPSASAPDLSTQGWKTFHRAVSSDAVQGPAAAAYLKSVLKATKVYVLDDASPYGSDLAEDVAARLQQAVVDRSHTDMDGLKSDLRATVLRIKSSQATALYYGGFPGSAGLLRKQLTAAGWNGVMISGDGIKDAEFVERAGNAAARGTVVTCLCMPADEMTGTFVGAFRARWNSEPDGYAGYAYDAASIFVRGLAAGKVTRQEINDQVSASPYVGVAGTYQFTSAGELVDQDSRAWIYKVDANGQFVPDRRAPTA